jgi:hypothetical protein
MLREDHKEIASGKRKDDEGYMARNELDSIERSIKNLRKIIKSSDTQLPAWVQSKITKAADYIDTAAEYLQSDEEVTEAKVIGILNPNDPKAQINKDKNLRTPNRIAKKLDTTGPESEVARRKAQQFGGTGAQLPKINKEEISLVEKILGEEKCGKGMYWCNTDKKCKPLPSGFNVPGQSKKLTEVGIGKGVNESKCTHTKKGVECPVHGMKECPMSEEKDPKGPVQPYKSPKEIAKKHGVSVEQIEKQLKMGIKVEGEHTSDKTSARITALQHLDEVPDYYTKLKKVEAQKESTIVRDADGNVYAEFIDLIKSGSIEDENPSWKRKKVNESVRLQAQNGNIISVVLSWRGKYHSLRLFFPQVRMPNRKEVTAEVQKIYPGSRVVTYTSADLNSSQPLVQIQNSKSKNYLLNNNTIGEEVEISEVKKK